MAEGARERTIPVGEMPDGSPVSLPLLAFGEGTPSVFVGCTIHGDEVTGQASLWKLRETLESEGIQGRVTLVPVMNPLGFNYNVRGVPQAAVDLNRLYPGDPHGALGERLTAKVWELARDHEVVLDVHTAGWCIPFVLLDPLTEELEARTRALAEATGVTVLQEFEADRYELQNLAASLPGVALKADIPSFTLELGGFKGVDWPSVQAGFVALRNLLLEVGVLDGEPRQVTSTPVIRETGLRRASLFASRGGILRYAEVPGASVGEGDPVAEVRNVFGERRATVRMPDDGYLIGGNAASVVPSGGYVATIAVEAEG